MKASFRLVALLFLALFSLQGRCDVGNYPKTFQTTKGVLEIYPVDERGRLLRKLPYSMEGGWRVLLNGKTILKQLDEYVVIEKWFPSNQKAELLLFEMSSGNSCEGRSRVIDVRGDKVVVSEEFGNCLPLAEPEEFKLKENPTYIDGAWRIGFMGHREGEVEWWVYKDGKVAREQSDAEMDKWPPEMQEYASKLRRLVQDNAARAKLIDQFGNPRDAYFFALDQKAKTIDPGKYQNRNPSDGTPNSK